MRRGPIRSWQQLLHQVNHATQHRSEAALLLTRLGFSQGGWISSFISTRKARISAVALGRSSSPEAPKYIQAAWFLRVHLQVWDRAGTNDRLGHRRDCESAAAGRAMMIVEGEAMQTLARGALAGLAATVPMTVVIGAGRAAGLMGTPPPVEITENVAEQAGEQPDRQSPEFQAAWLAAHIGYGAACGVIFSAIRPVLPRSDLVAGLLFGGAVWGVSYVSLMPSPEPLSLRTRRLESAASRHDRGACGIRDSTGDYRASTLHRDVTRGEMDTELRTES